MNDVIFRILIYVLSAGAVAFVGFMFPAVKKWGASVEAELKETEHNLAAAIVHDAVYAMEQVVEGAKKGEYKKDKAMQIIRVALDQYHIKMTDAQIDAMLEAVVLAMNNDMEL